MPGSPPIVITEDDDDDGAGGPAKMASTVGQDGASADCLICYEPYSESHRPATLRCGHVAGEACLRRWLRNSKFCPNCRKRAKDKDIVPLFNLPTVVVAAPSAGGGGAVPSAAASGAGATPSELAQKELVLQKVQRAYSEKEKEALKQAEEARRLGQEAKRRTKEALANEQEAKRLRRELEEAKRLLTAMQQMGGAAGPGVAAAGGRNYPTPTPSLGPGFRPNPYGAPPPAQHEHRMQHSGGGDGGGGGGLGPGSSGRPHPVPQTQQGHHNSHHHEQQQPHHHFVPTGPLGHGPTGGPHLTLQAPSGAQRHGGTAPGTAYPGMYHAPGAVAAGAAYPVATQMAMTTSTPPPQGSMWGHFANMQPGATSAPEPAPNCGGSDAPMPHHLDGTRGLYGNSALQYHQQRPLPLGGYGAAAAAGSGASGSGSSGGGGGPFQLLFSVPVEGSRLVALDVSGSKLLVSEARGSGASAITCIRKVSLAEHKSYTHIRLPTDAGIVYDMQLQAAAAGGGGSGGQRFLAVATQGSGLRLVCTRSDSVVAAFTGLPYRVWCCSWIPYASAAAPFVAASGGFAVDAAGPCSEYQLVVGLDKGHLALLDTRRTDRPVAMASVLHHDGCAPLPVRTVAVLPSCGARGQAVAVDAAADGGGGAVWPTCALSCVKGAWLMVPGGGGDAALEAPPLALYRLDGKVRGGGMQLESMSVLAPSEWGWHGGGGGGVGGPQPSWRAVLSWRAAGGVGGGAVAGGPMAAAAVPRHEVGWLRAHEHEPYKHEATVTDYSRHGIQSVRSCLIPDMAVTVSPAAAEGGPGLLLASSDDDTRQPLIWSLGGASAASAAGGHGGGGGPHVLQRLEPHPQQQPPVCMVAAAGTGGSCYLACGSKSRVDMYRRLGG